MARRKTDDDTSLSESLDSNDFFEIMGNAVRRQIIHMLSGGPLSMRELDGFIDVSRQAILKHLAFLKDKGVVIEAGDDTKDEESQGRRGPAPTRYAIGEFYQFQYELAPSFSQPRIMTVRLLSGSNIPDDAALEKEVLPPGAGEPLRKKTCIERLMAIEDKMRELTLQHRELYFEKTELLRQYQAVLERFDEREERQVLAYLFRNPEKALNGFTMEEIANGALPNLRKDFVDPVMKKLVEEGLLQRDGNLFFLSDEE